MATLKLTVVNQSPRAGTATLFQRAEYPFMALAWQARPSMPNTNTVFEWSDSDFAFVCNGSVQVRPGAVFQTSQSMAGNPTNQNSSTLESNRSEVYFTAPERGESPGVFSIRTSGSLPHGSSAAAGIGLAGNAMLVTQVQSNMMYLLTPKREFMLAMTSAVPGQVLDPNTQNAVSISYGPGVTAHTATLRADGTWTVT